MDTEQAIVEITRALAQLIQRETGSVDDLLLAADIPVEIKADNSESELRVSFAQFGILHTLISEHLQDESFGFDDGAYAPLGNVSTVWRLMETDSTLHSATLMVQGQLSLLRAKYSSYSIATHSGVSSYGFKRGHWDDFRDDALMLVNDATHIFWWWRWCEWLIGDPIELSCVRFMGTKNVYSEALGSLFSVPIHYGSERNSFDFPEGYGAHAIVRTRSELTSRPLDLFHNIGRGLDESERSKLPTSKKVSALLMHVFDNELPTLTQTAKMLHMAPSTLRRHLSNEGTSFQNIKDQCRQNVALRLIENTTMSVAEIAEAVGFSNPAAFYKAFKRWTGSTPRDRLTMDD